MLLGNTTNQLGKKGKLIIFVQQQLKYTYNILNVLMNIHRVNQQKEENKIKKTV